MAWAATGDRLLVGGHGNLLVSTDGGRSFERSTSILAGGDVHAVGATGSNVMASTPNDGLFISHDGGPSQRTAPNRP